VFRAEAATPRPPSAKAQTTDPIDEHLARFIPFGRLVDGGSLIALRQLSNAPQNDAKISARTVCRAFFERGEQATNDFGSRTTSLACESKANPS
jgi:hypothetical protein